MIIWLFLVLIRKHSWRISLWSWIFLILRKWSQRIKGINWRLRLWGLNPFWNIFRRFWRRLIHTRIRKNIGTIMLIYFHLVLDGSMRNSWILLARKVMTNVFSMKLLIWWLQSHTLVDWFLSKIVCYTLRRLLFNRIV